MPFWRREPLHHRLARKGGLAFADQEPRDVAPGWMPTGVHGIARARRWDVVASAHASGLPGREVHFVALPDGTLVVEEDVPDNSLTPLAEAVEATLSPPYRAEAVLKEGQVWAIAANAIEVVELPEHLEGDEIELAVQGDQHTLLVDGERAEARLPELEALAEGDAYVTRAERLDGSLWEVKVAPL